MNGCCYFFYNFSFNGIFTYIYVCAEANEKLTREQSVGYSISNFSYMYTYRYIRILYFIINCATKYFLSVNKIQMSSALLLLRVYFTKRSRELYELCKWQFDIDFCRSIEICHSTFPIFLLSRYNRKNEKYSIYLCIKRKKK